jgi:hypothetical protein
MTKDYKDYVTIPTAYGRSPSKYKVVDFLTSLSISRLEWKNIQREVSSLMRGTERCPAGGAQRFVFSNEKSRILH